MEVILLEKVGKIGSFGDTVNVKSGYARNYLIPGKKALPATEKNKQYFEEKRIEFEKQLLNKQTEDQNRADLLKSCSLRIEMNSHDDGQLYGSVGVKEIATLIAEKEIEIQKNEIHLPNAEAIKVTGEYIIHVQLNPDLAVEIPLEVVAAEEEQSTVQVERGNDTRQNVAQTENSDTEETDTNG